jgi:hypothetical protein
VIVAAGLIIVLAAIVIARRRSSDGLAVDVLQRLLDLSPPARQQWISAMVAEFDVLDDQRSKRRFARGCLRAVLFTAGPSDRTATVTSGLIDLLAACAVSLAFFGLVHYPGLRDGWAWMVYLALFLAIVAAYTFAGVHVGRMGSPTARWAGTLAGTPAALCGWWIAQSNGGAIGFAAMLVIALPCAIAAAVVAKRQRRMDLAVVVAMCAALSAGLFAFVSYVATTYATLAPPSDALLQEFARSGAHDYRSWVVGDDLGGAVFLLLFVPVLTTVLGLVAARLASPSAPTSAVT